MRRNLIAIAIAATSIAAFPATADETDTHTVLHEKLETSLQVVYPNRACNGPGAEIAEIYGKCDEDKTSFVAERKIDGRKLANGLLIAVIGAALLSMSR